MAISYPIGLTPDNEKGDTQGAVTAGRLSSKNIWPVGTDAIGSDTNKKYEGELITDYEVKKTGSSKKSFSTAFSLPQGNIAKESWEGLVNIKAFKPLASSLLLNAASFIGLKGLKTASYTRAFTVSDNWADSWIEFDPENANY